MGIKTKTCINKKKMSNTHSGQWGVCSLWDAAADGDLEAMKKRLTSSWTKIDAKDSDGNTALIEAARWGHDNCVEYLLENKAGLTISNGEGQTAMHIAAQQGRDSTLRLLVAKGADVNVLDDDGDTPLMYAAARDKLTTISTLLELKADKSIKNKKGKDALAVAASTERVKAGDVEFASFTKY